MALNYEFISTFHKYTYVYIFEYKQLYEKNTSHVSGTHYRCKDRDCHSSIKKVNDIYSIYLSKWCITSALKHKLNRIRNILLKSGAKKNLSKSKKINVKNA